MATALSLDRPSALAALRATAHTRPALLARLAAMAAVPETELLAGIVLTDAGRSYASGMIDRLREAVEEAASPTASPRLGLA